MNADVLSDVLRAVRLTGAVYFDFNLSSPWVAETPAAREIAAKVMPGAQRVVEYHLVAAARAGDMRSASEPIHLREGDLILFPQGDAHVLSSAPGMRTSPDWSIFARPTTPLPLVYERGGGGPEQVRLVCGFLGCDERPYNPLLAALPTTIHLPATGPEATSGWLSTLLNIAAREAGNTRPGSENVLARLSELMFVEAIRRYPRDAPAGPDGLAGGIARPGRRTGVGGAPRRAERAVDGRTARAPCRPFAFGLRRAIHGNGRAAADAIPGVVAHAARFATAG